MLTATACDSEFVMVWRMVSHFVYGSVLPTRWEFVRVFHSELLTPWH